MFVSLHKVILLWDTMDTYLISFIFNLFNTKSMMNFTQRIKFVLVMALSLIGLSAQAIDQITLGELTYTVKETYEVQFNTIEHVAYSGETIDWTRAYNATCELLGIESVATNDLLRVDAEGNAFPFDTNDGWGSADGMVDGFGWGNALGVCVKAWNVNEQDEVVIDGTASYFGCFDEQHNEGDEVHAYYAVVKDADAVVIDFHIFFQKNEGEVEVPEPATLLAKELNVVGAQSVIVERTTIQGYEATQICFDPAKIAEALGIETATLAAALPKMLYMQECNSDLILTDEVAQNYTAGAPGWWMQRTIYPEGHELGGEDSPYLGAAAWSAQDAVFAEVFQINEALDSLTANVGQYPNNLKDGDDLIANIYCIWGDKAYKLEIEVKITAAATTGLEGMTEIGSKQITVQQYPTTDYSTSSFSVDLASIAAVLGCEANAVTYKCLQNENTFYPGANTANGIGGYWFNKEGYVCNWGSGGEGSFFFIEPVESGSFDMFNIGQFPNDYAVGDSAVTDQFFVHGEQYYRVHVHMDIIEKPVIDTDEWTIVANRNIVVKQTPNDGYVWSEQVGIIKSQDLINLLGTNAPVLYGEAIDEEGNVTKTEDYTMGEKPGFWMTSDGYAAAWGNNTTWGMTSQPATTGATGGDWGFKCMQFPGSGTLGSSFSGTFYLLNPENLNCIKVTLVSQVVESVAEQEIIGEEDLVLPVTLNGESVEFALAPIAEKFGITEDELYGGNYLHGIVGGAVPVTTGLQFDEKGNIDESGNGAIGLMWESEESLFVYSNMDTEVADDWSAVADVIFEVDAKQYILHVRFVSMATYQEILSSINTIKAGKFGSAIFDLSGRQVEKAVKGIFIQNGKKVVK